MSDPFNVPRIGDVGNVFGLKIEANNVEYGWKMI
jgi:hypothetical protein